MNVHLGTTALATLASIAGLWIMLFWLYRDYSVDRFRQEMFALRDELFEEAMASAVGFSHPAYGVLRSTMNCFIRFAHRFTLLHALLLLAATGREDTQRTADTFPARWQDAIENLSEEQRRSLTKYRLRMNVLVLQHLVRSSPILVMTIVFPVAAWIAIRVFLGQLLRLLRSPLDGIDSAALAEGQS
jgi:hypothetical protein